MPKQIWHTWGILLLATFAQHVQTETTPGYHESLVKSLKYRRALDDRFSIIHVGPVPGSLVQELADAVMDKDALWWQDCWPDQEVIGPGGWRSEGSEADAGWCCRTGSGGCFNDEFTYLRCCISESGYPRAPTKKFVSDVTVGRHWKQMQAHIAVHGPYDFAFYAGGLVTDTVLHTLPRIARAGYIVLSLSSALGFFTNMTTSLHGLGTLHHKLQTGRKKVYSERGNLTRARGLRNSSAQHTTVKWWWGSSNGGGGSSTSSSSSSSSNSSSNSIKRGSLETLLKSAGISHPTALLEARWVQDVPSAVLDASAPVEAGAMTSLQAQVARSNFPIICPQKDNVVATMSTINFDLLQKVAFLTYVSARRLVYVDGAMMLGRSLKQHVPSVRRVALIEELSQPPVGFLERALLKAGWDEFISGPAIHPRNAPIGPNDGLFSKVLVFNPQIIKYETVVFLDSDSWVRSPRIIELFDPTLLNSETPIAMVPDTNSPGNFNTGVMVYQPNLKQFYSIFELLMAGWDNDQPSVNQVFEGRIKNLNPVFNVHGNILLKHQLDEHDAVVVHFTGRVQFKPMHADVDHLLNVRQGSGEDPKYGLLGGRCLHVEYFKAMEASENWSCLSPELGRAVQMASARTLA